MQSYHEEKVGSNNTKEKICWFLSVLIFLSVFFSLFSKASDIFRKKHTDADMVHSLYYLEDNSIDVLAVGSSHLYYAYSPSKVWGDKGIPSFMLGDPAQTMAMAYYLLKEALQFQQPKVVLLDSYGFYYDSFTNKEERLRVALDNMKLFHGLKLNLNKIQMIQAAIPDASWQKKMTFLIPFSEYHARWNQLSQSDFTPDDGEWLLGGKLGFHCKSFDNPPKVKIQDVQLHAIQLEYLDKIRALCEERDIQLVFCILPIACEKEDYYYENQYMNATLKKYLEEQNVPYLDVMENAREPIDYGKDFYDAGHVNYYGQVKLTESIEAYLEDHFQLEDHREDPEYKEWNELYNIYLEHVKNAMNGKGTEEKEGAEG